MDTSNIAKAQGHWILAKMGKKVLRPGGRELTNKLVEGLSISAQDDVVEFAPGLGYTAALAISKRPKTYTGVDADLEAAKRLKKIINKNGYQIIHGNAAQTSIESGCKTKVYGEAMLTMHADHRKTEIIKEAHRILKKGGLYAIHELGLTPNTISEELKATIQKDLAIAIKVNARPLTEKEWSDLLEKEGFKIKSINTNSMSLLEPSRIIQDEGFFGALKIGFNILTHSVARKRILEMKSVFSKHAQHMNSVAIVAEKI